MSFALSGLTGFNARRGGLDPFWDDVILYIDGVGANGQTTQTDQSQYGTAVTLSNGAECRTAQSRYGTSSIFCDGSNDVFGCADNALWELGTSDYTIEFDFYPLTVPGGTVYLAGQTSAAAANADTSFAIGLTAGKMNSLACSGAAVIGQVLGTTTISANNWYNGAYVRSGSNFYEFVEGVSQAAPAVSALGINNSPGSLAFGQTGSYTGPTYFHGYIANIRITLRARYTASYTPYPGLFPKG